ncbi:hypothetical protein BJF92_12230 [Rhizobium rhizosphaerae]|uniref:Baseplate protein J-like domain-containing protein n=1 Tax=Xaviernesmea rhizosphaerae TaxID=1672749 RepID=A0A1Q9AN53_9HYPH|nr:baseplate J/gp47 family protein [Xaviernesmea rhizosphaerae]OLP56832.1 hypothetical protein BJF92_12230 [Xaviernesmea rhizosphaerae]
MAWIIRSPAEISGRLRGAFRQYLPGTDTALKNNVLTVIVKVLALLAHEFELRMAALSRQMFLTTATDLRWVRLHASEIGIYQRQPSAAAGLVTGSGAAQAVYPAGIRLVSGDMTYLTTAPALSGADGSLSFAVACEIKGVAGNREAGGLLGLADPALHPSLSLEWTVGAGGLGGGADVEGIEELRARALARKRNPPGGGTLTDYERMATDVPGVLKAWAYRPQNAPGMLVVYFLFAGRAGSIPQPSDVAVVQAAIDARRMIRLDDSVAVAPIARPVNVTIGGLQSDTDEIRAAIAAGIAAMYVARCRPGYPDDSFTLPISWISEVISGVAGEERHRLVAPSADIVLTSGQFPVNGTIAYVA